jgi:hypothetical protein
LLVSKELHDLAKRLQKARIDDDYVETDLRTWTNILEKLKDDMNLYSSSIFLQEDETQTVVGKMYVSTINQPSRQIEKFGEFFGNIRIDNNGLLATHCGPYNDMAFVRGISEYSSGKHKIRFRFKKIHANIITYFRVVSKLMPINGKKTKYEGYGWSNMDGIFGPNEDMLVDNNYQDMKDQTKFEIELELDCDNRKISYVNQGTKNKREMNVDITECPFPWQVEFCVYERGDCVQLLP